MARKLTTKTKEIVLNDFREWVMKETLKSNQPIGLSIRALDKVIPLYLKANG